jgi:dihydrofolate synthase/folylpolyglutamate synthase
MVSALNKLLPPLYSRVPLGMRLGLDAMREACAANANPERAVPVIHVAGTNGKGSTCAMVEAMARSAGLRTGLYTSPHLARFAERIRINGEPIDDDLLSEQLEIALKSDLSFFETATLAAFLAFRHEELDVAILEVGIGGRLDATNVVRAAELRCAAVTRVAIDHQDRLGNTLEEIAEEKLAIGKAGRPIVLGPTVPDLPTHGRVVRATVVDEAVEVTMEGPHQRENAGVAWAIAQELGIPVDARAEGLAKAVWPGRFERIGGGRIAGPWILDGAHNPDGMSALVDALAEAEVSVGAVVFGALVDKAWQVMEQVLDARLPVPRFHAAPRGRPAAKLPDTRPLAVSLAAARAAAGPEHVVVVCGSIYLVGEARSWLLGLPTDPPVAL